MKNSNKSLEIFFFLNGKKIAIDKMVLPNIGIPKVNENNFIIVIIQILRIIPGLVSHLYHILPNILLAIGKKEEIESNRRFDKNCTYCRQILEFNNIKERDEKQLIDGHKIENQFKFCSEVHNVFRFIRDKSITDNEIHNIRLQQSIQILRGILSKINNEYQKSVLFCPKKFLSHVISILHSLNDTFRDSVKTVQNISLTNFNTDFYDTTFLNKGNTIGACINCTKEHIQYFEYLTQRIHYPRKMKVSRWKQRHTDQVLMNRK